MTRLMIHTRHVRTAALILFGFVATFLVAGNLAILGASAWAKEAAPGSDVETPEGIRKFAVVDDRVWRGAAPGPEGYASLAERGVKTVVDLRAEEDLHVDEDHLSSLGLRYMHIPIRDGQAPTSEEVAQFLQAVRETDGITFVHCGAGVGRTGTMAGSYLVASGQATSKEALQRNLAVGPPSLEQVAFVADLDGTDVDRPPGAVVAVSRVLDAPRRLWFRYGL
ncbi:MAG TPA: dual specificity protein phosphatase family protein [Acidimicrobiales bacterium]|nr:dual specificity protein phosphatase family protein [Acidimicrobiales bacterium]